MSHDVKSKALAMAGVEREEFLAGVAEMVAWLQNNPDVPISRHAFDAGYFTTYEVWIEDDPIITSPSRLARVMARGGKAVKDAYMGQFDITRKFCGGIQYRVSLKQDKICEAKTVGHRDVKEQQPVDTDRATQLQAELDALETHEVVTGTEPIIEYNCEPLLKK